MDYKIQHVGIDWLTLTSRDDRQGGIWWELYTNYRKQALKDGDEERPYNNGFYVGVRIGHYQWGYSEHLGYILIVSSSAAAEIWPQLLPIRWRITRIDLCVDIAYAKPIDLAVINYGKKMAGELPTIPQFKLWQNSKGGCTLYVGSRQSQQFGRLYDKGMESGKAKKGTLWRAEVEYKKPISEKVAQAIERVDFASMQQVIISTVQKWYADRGCELFLSEDDSHAIETTVQATITTNQKRLTWIRSQVAPTIAKLMGQGLQGETVDALGLTPKDLVKIWGAEIWTEVLPDV